MPETIHDRMSQDLPLNATVAVAVVRDEQGDYIRVVRSIRTDPLAGLHARGHIDDAQLMAGRKWQKLHLQSTIGAIRAIDPMREAVDGCCPREAITDKQINAFKELRESYRALGPELGRLVYDILAEEIQIQDAALRRGMNEWGAKKLGMDFRYALNVLAILYGFAGRGQSYANQA